MIKWIKRKIAKWVMSTIVFKHDNSKEGHENVASALDISGDLAKFLALKSGEIAALKRDSRRIEWFIKNRENVTIEELIMFIHGIGMAGGQVASMKLMREIDPKIASMMGLAAMLNKTGASKEQVANIIKNTIGTKDSSNDMEDVFSEYSKILDKNRDKDAE